MHMKYLPFVIHEFLSVYLICSATKLTSQIEAKFKCRPKGAKLYHYFISVVLLSIHIVKYCYCLVLGLEFFNVFTLKGS